MIDEIVRKATRAYAQECRRHAGALGDEAERRVRELPLGYPLDDRVILENELVKALRAGAQSLNQQAALAIEAEPAIIESTRKALQ